MQLREAYHARIGETLEILHPSPDGATAVEICDHFFRGAKGDRALPYLDAAFGHLEGGYMNDRTIALADRALAAPALREGPKRAALLLRKARTLDRLGRREQQRATIEEVLQAPPDAESLLAARLALAGLLARIQDNSSALRILEELLPGVRASSDAKKEAVTLEWMAMVLDHLGRLEEANARQAEALALRRGRGDRSDESISLAHTGWRLLRVGRQEEARRAIEAGLRVAREAGDLGSEANATCLLGNAFNSDGDFARAAELYLRYLDIARKTGSRLGEGYALGNLGMIELALGRYRRAMELLEASRTIEREIDNPLGEVVALANKGSLQTTLGQFEAAERTFAEAMALSGKIGSRENDAYIRLFRSRIATEKGRLDEALADAEAARAFFLEIGHAGVEAEALLQITRVRRARRETEDARHILATASDLARGADTPRPELWIESARAAWFGENAGRALTLLESCGERLQHAEKLEVRFLLYQATGDRAHLAEAKRLLEFAVEHSPEDCRESMLRNVRLHREIAAAAERAGL